ncbi:MAG: hypothetical protein KAV00_06985 [Phycisphaerae bacterium]|nr:hypothetical protein [Phycisphaerae bacterium]
MSEIVIDDFFDIGCFTIHYKVTRDGDNLSPALWHELDNEQTKGVPSGLVECLENAAEGWVQDEGSDWALVKANNAIEREEEDRDGDRLYRENVDARPRQWRKR